MNDLTALRKLIKEGGRMPTTHNNERERKPRKSRAKDQDAWKALPIYTGDFETDPFAYNQMIRPFAAGLYDGKECTIFWERNPVKRFFEYLATLPAGIVYFHNLGGFDFFWMLQHFKGESCIRNGRIVTTYVDAANGGVHEMRDSYAIMPFALSEYKKDGQRVKLEIDIDKLSASKRRRYRDEIIKYLKVDCTSLYELVTRFLERFGNKITVGSAAMDQLKQVHDFIEVKEKTEDELIRNKFFYGGRVQCFEAGLIEAPFKVYDVNSMYPYVMRDYLHPVSRLDSITPKITKDTCFIEVEGWNNGAFPQRDTEGSLHFDVPYGVFGVSIHEYEVAKRYGLFKTKRILGCFNYKIRRSFAGFVNKFYQLRKEAKQEKDDVMALFYKYILNSSYGKFAQDSGKYFDYQITPDTVTLAYMGECKACREDTCTDHWRADQIIPEAGIIMWKRSNGKPVYYNVSTGSSITGAARSVLLDAISKSQRPLYCDTDSLICAGLPGVVLSETEIGAWKLEATGTKAAIAGKKLYALFDGKKIVKQANKGCDISADEIAELAEDEEREIMYEKQSPTLHLNGSYTFLHRTIRRTV